LITDQQMPLRNHLMPKSKLLEHNSEVCAMLGSFYSD